MPTRTIVEDYVLAAMARVRHAWAENGTLVLTIPEFPGMVACGADVPSAMRDLYRRLEDWIQLSLERGYSLPIMHAEEGDLDLNSSQSRGHIMYHSAPGAPSGDRGAVFIGGPDEMEVFLDANGRD